MTLKCQVGGLFSAHTWTLPPRQLVPTDLRNERLRQRRQISGSFMESRWQRHDKNLLSAAITARTERLVTALANIKTLISFCLFLQEAEILCWIRKCPWIQLTCKYYHRERKKKASLVVLAQSVIRDQLWKKRPGLISCKSESILYLQQFFTWGLLSEEEVLSVCELCVWAVITTMLLSLLQTFSTW